MSKACATREALRRRRTNQRRRLLLEGGDPYFDNVILLLDFADGTATDKSNFEQSTALRTGSSIVTNDSIYGGNSLYVNGTGSGLDITTVDDSWDCGDQDYTVEMWIRRAAHDVNNYHYDLGFVTAKFYTPTEDPNRQAYYFTSTGGGTDGPNYGGYVCAYAWTHYAAVRHDGTSYCYVNGVLDFSESRGAGYAPGTSQTVYLGNTAGGSAGMTGAWFDLVRVTMGVARYPDGTSFTPPESYE